MNRQDNLDSNKKFLFDLNNFDPPKEKEEIVEVEEIEVEPPPPTFSEDELEAAKAVAHSAGKAEGIAEERGRREQEVATLLKQVSQNFTTLFATEIYREKQYEEEAVRLAQQVVSILTPAMDNLLGKEALKSALLEVLTKQSGQSEIRVEVHPEMSNDIDALISTIWPDKDMAPNYKVVANGEIEKSACKMSWKDGGMVRDPQKIANDIKIALESLLPEQVGQKVNSTITSEGNNAIKNQQPRESAAKSDDVDHNGE